jgi:hypothetical protein
MAGDDPEEALFQMSRGFLIQRTGHIIEPPIDPVKNVAIFENGEYCTAQEARGQFPFKEAPGTVKDAEIGNGSLI